MTVSRLFVYGTLQDEDQVRRLIGRPLPWQPAVLTGYRRSVDPSIGYPVVHAAPGSRVDGKLLEGIDDRVLEALDAYEGDQYRRIIAQVQTSGGGAVDAYVYVPAQARPAGA